MKRRSIVALGLVVVLAASCGRRDVRRDEEGDGQQHHRLAPGRRAVGLAGCRGGCQPEVPGRPSGDDRERAVPELGDHLQKFDATLAGGGRPDVIEMGNTEMTKYMAAGRLRRSLDKSTFDELAHVAEGPRRVGRLRRQDLRRPVLRGLARRHLPHRPVQGRRHHEAADDDRASTSPTRRSASRKNSKKGFSPVYIAGTDWYVAMGFVYDYGGSIAQQVSGKWKGLLELAEVDRRPDRVQELLPRDLAGQQDHRRDAPEPVRRVRTGPGRLDGRPELVQLLRRQEVHRRNGAVRDAEPRQGPGHPGLPRRLRPRSAGTAPTRRSRRDWIKDFTSTSSEKALQAKGNIPNATNLLGASVNERAAARSWFVPTAKHWVDVENGNILRNMLAQILTGKLSIQQAAASASDNIASVLNQS